jgi:hypothetical protein
MDVVALSPVLVDRLVWRRDAERWALTVVVKATFDLAPGEVRLASQPIPVTASDVHEGNSAGRALVAPTDLVPFKARADVILVGHAYAPHGRPVSALTARLAACGVDKSIAVVGNRIVSPRGVGPALPFAKMLLSYERAAGGPGTSNPVGMPRGERLPNLEPVGWSPGLRGEKPGAPAPSLRGDAPPPIGFGPVAPAWPERAARRRPWREGEPLPEDFDPGFFNAAPLDQQVAFLRGDEPIVLEHLHPDHAVLATRLPGVVPRAFADRRLGAPEPVEMLADTLWIDTDRRKLTIVWRGEARLASPDEAGRVLVAMTNAREPLGWEQMRELYRALSASGAADRQTIDDEAGDEDSDDMMRSTNAVPAARLPAHDGGRSMRSHADAGARTAGLPSFDDEDSADDLPSHLDPLNTSTRAFEVPGAGMLPGAAPAWLVTPSRQNAAVPPRRPHMPSQLEPPPRPALQSMSAADLVWDSPADLAEPRTMPPPAAFAPLGETAETPAVLAQPPAGTGQPGMLSQAPTSIGLGQPPPGIGMPQSPAGIGQPGMMPSPAGMGQPGMAHPPAMVAPSPSAELTPAQPPAAPPIEHARTGPLPVATSPEPASPWASGLEPGSFAQPIAALSPVAVPVQKEAPPEAPRPAWRAPLRAPTEAVDLLWFDPDSVARIGSRFRDIVDDLDMEPLDPAHDLPVDDPAAARDRHHVFGVLTRAPLTEARGVPAAVRAATDAHGRFTAPLVVVEGELLFSLDELRVLKTTAACAKPLAKDNKRLQDVLASIDEVADTPLLVGAAGATEGLLREVLAAASQSKRALPVKVLEEHVERLLLGQRAYQLRTVLGGPQIRAVLTPGRESSALVSYVPEAVAPKLPLSLRFRARVIAEVHPSPDPQEAAPLALRVVALSRLVPLPGRG